MAQFFINRPVFAWVVSILIMVLGSLASRKRVPADVGRTMVQLHAPERLRLGQ